MKVKVKDVGTCPTSGLEMDLRSEGHCAKLGFAPLCDFCKVLFLGTQPWVAVATHCPRLTSSFTQLFIERVPSVRPTARGKKALPGAICPQGGKSHAQGGGESFNCVRQERVNV